MTSIQQVFNSIDLRRKIFNFKTEPKKEDWEWEINDARDYIIHELNNHIFSIYLERYHIHPPFHLTIEEVYDLSKNEYINMLIDYRYEFVSEIILEQINYIEK